MTQRQQIIENLTRLTQANSAIIHQLTEKNRAIHQVRTWLLDAPLTDDWLNDMLEKISAVRRECTKQNRWHLDQGYYQAMTLLADR